MRRPARVAILLGLSALAFGGCAAIEGLDGISEQACAPDCGDSGADGTTTVGPDGSQPGIDAPISDDSTTPNDTTVPPTDDTGTGEDATQPEDAPVTDTGNDTSTPEDSSPGGDSSAEDAGTDAPEVTDTGAPDTGTDAGIADSGVDTGCGPLTSIDNCSACGDVCTATNATLPECNGSTCSYTCKSGYIDCDKGLAPDIDGCECNVSAVATAPACCGTTCPLEHSYNENLGAGADFYDCVTAGTYNVSLAMDACTAFTGDASLCTSGYYCPQFPDGGGTDLGDQVCAVTASTCQCWTYNGSLVGLVSPSSGNPSECYCPQTGGSAIHWD